MNEKPRLVAGLLGADPSSSDLESDVLAEGSPRLKPRHIAAQGLRILLLHVVDELKDQGDMSGRQTRGGGYPLNTPWRVAQ